MWWILVFSIIMLLESLCCPYGNSFPMAERTFVEVFFHFFSDLLRFKTYRIYSLPTVTTIEGNLSSLFIECGFSFFSKWWNIDEIKVGCRHTFESYDIWETIRKQKEVKEGVFEIMWNESILCSKEILEPSFFCFSSFRLKKCLIQFLLIWCDFFWHFYLYMEDKTPLLSLTIQSRNTIITKCKCLTMLSPRLYIEWFFSDDRNLNHTCNSENCFCRRDLDRIVQVRPLSNESCFFVWNFKYQIQIPITILAWMSFATHFHAHATLDTCWDIDGFFFFVTDFSLPMTVMTLLDHFLACSMTGMTWTSLLYHTKYRLHSFSDLSTSMTCMTGFGFSSFSIAMMTEIVSCIFYLSIGSLDRILERYPYTYLDIFSDISLASLSTAESPTKKWWKNITEIPGIKSSLKSSAESSHSFCWSESIIIGFLLWIWENWVCFIDLFEFRLFSLISTMTIRMEFHCFLFVGTLDLISTGRLTDSEYIVVFFWHSKNKIEKT